MPNEPIAEPSKTTTDSQSAERKDLYASLGSEISIEEVRKSLEALGTALESIDRSRRIRPETYQMQFGVENSR